ncbi:MAG: VWA domain-containing protein [Kiritimatiellales bacterium]
MIFQAPWFLLLLLILPILGKIDARARRLKMKAAEKLRGKRNSSNHWKKTAALRIGSLAALVIALAQPAWNPHPGPPGEQGHDLVIALDISRSMLAADVFPNRLEAAKIALFESLDQLRGQQIGLITFAGAASVRVPLTLDHNFIRYMLERAAPSDAEVGGTSLQAAIEKAIDVVLKESEKGRQDMIILTDGEDHISNIEKTTQELRDCGARVLIVGLGDIDNWTKIPDIGKTNSWMQYKGSDVTSHLEEVTLNLLSVESPNVVYYSAQTRPFDLLDLYTKLIDDTKNLPLEGDRPTVYTEGYPLFIALALLLWAWPAARNRLFPAILALLVASCSPNFQTLEKDYQQHVDQGRTLWTQAQPSVEADPRAALSTLTNAREEFLRAALLIPGNERAAQQIAGITAQMHQIEQAIQEQEEAEKDLQEKLQEAVEALKVLTQRETVLSQQSQQLLKRRPPAPAAEKTAAADPARQEQVDIGTGTAGVLDVVTDVQAVIQKMLAGLYGKEDAPPPTEFDQAVEKLNHARTSQQSAVESLTPDAVNWPQANSALLTASRRMQEALDLLASQNSQNQSDENSDDGDESDWDFDENMEWDESSQMSDLSMPIDSSNFKTALENKALPAPNYSAEDILKQEEANMEQRAEQNAARAGAKVEKNW